MHLLYWCNFLLQRITVFVNLKWNDSNNNNNNNNNNNKINDNNDTIFARS